MDQGASEQEQPEEAAGGVPSGSVEGELERKQQTQSDLSLKGSPVLKTVIFEKSLLDQLLWKGTVS